MASDRLEELDTYFGALPVHDCKFKNKYSWNLLTRSRWDQRKYLELSEVQAKHRLFLCRLRSIAAHRDHFVRRLSLCVACEA